MTNASGDSDKDADYIGRIDDRALTISAEDFEGAYFQVLAEVLELQDAPYVSGYRIWRYELPWLMKNVTRLGYLIMSTPEERSIAQPSGDFYLYFPPWSRPPAKQAGQPDELTFDIAPGDEFVLNLRRYAAASRLRSESTLSYRLGYDDPLRVMWTQLVHWLRRHFAEAFSVSRGDTTKPLTEWALSAKDRKTRPRDYIDTVAAALLADHFEIRYPRYPVFETAIIPTASSGENRVPLHPWSAVRRRPMAELAVQQCRTASPTGNPSLQESVSDAGRFLDLCSGVATIAEAATQQGLSATAIDSSPVATLIARTRLEYERDLSLLSRAEGWGGLLDEVSEAAKRLLVAAQATAGSRWLADVDGVLLVATVTCPSCSADAAEVNQVRLNSDVYLTVESKLGTLIFVLGPRRVSDPGPARRCQNCGTQVSRTPRITRRYVPAAIAIGRGRDRTWTLAPATSPIQGLEADVEFPFPSTDALFTRERSRELTWRAMTSPRQRAVVAALRGAAIDELQRLRARGLKPRAVEAMEAHLALFVSAMLPYLTLATNWSWPGRVSPAPSRGVWAPSASYLEVGGATIDSAWLRRVEEAFAAGNAPRPSVQVRRGDARHLAEPDAGFDLAIWDPPFYDNVDYDSLAAPFEQVLRSIAPEHPDLVGDSYHDSQRRFDASAYRDDLHAMASEAHRVLAEGGHLGVWWLSRTPDDLQNLIDLVAGVGFELRTAISVDTERGPKSPNVRAHKTYVLVFQKAFAAVPVEATVVLALADAGLPNLYHGVASILEEEYSTEELEEMIPKDFRGDLRDRLVEFVATNPRPDELLSDLGRRPLRAVAIRLGIDADSGADVRHLARLVLASLGFLLPETPTFSIEVAADELRHLASDLRLARDFDDAILPFGRAEQNVLSVLRLTVACWARLMDGDAWAATIGGLVEEASGRFAGTNRMTLGDWKSCFGELPKRLQAAGSATTVLFQTHQRTLRKLRTTVVLDTFVGVRNRVSHPGDEPAPTVSRIADSVSQVAVLIDGLIDAQVLPVILTPQEERLDRWGRRFLVAINGRGGTVELVVSKPVDLAYPIVWIPRLVNPREVDPILMTVGQLEPVVNQTGGG